MTDDSIVTVNRLELLRFYDMKGSIGHATAVNAVAGEELGIGLLKHYLENVGKAKEVKILYKGPTTGKSHGPRLDKWVLVTGKADEKTLYQVEIKNWSSHSLNGKCLAVEPTPEALEKHGQNRWKKYWNDGVFKEKALQKVLCEMKPPDNYEGYTIEPVACIWDVVQPKLGGKEPWFSVDVKTNDSNHKKVWFFSMSLYLRGLEGKTITLSMPDTRKRVTLIDSLFTTLGSGG